ncbi:uncharacterized protein [Diadema antillarum]|uniref:uncharacterized protein n=1 Tax=Diadema antillarum TaxID=105358 RepID=UPI003A83F152
MSTLKRHFNRPVSLIFITLPAVISLALCPCLLLLQLPLVTAFWPDGMTNINDAVGCFLAPAGLVYAVTFGFTFQSVLDKQRMITVTVSAEVGLLDQILVMASRMKSLTCQKKLKIFKLVKTEVISIMQQVTGLRGMSSKDYLHEYSAGQIWGLVDVLQADDKGMENCDSTMMDKMISNLQELSTCASQRHMTLAYTVHPLLWLFLEMLGFFSFVGVMLIRTGSVQMDLMMCIITVFSISLLCYVVGDLDSPFSGHFRVDLGSLWHLVGKSEHFYREQQRATNKARVNGADQKAPSRSIPNLINSVVVPGMTSFGSDLDMNF